MTFTNEDKASQTNYPDDITTSSKDISEKIVKSLRENGVENQNLCNTIKEISFGLIADAINSERTRCENVTNSHLVKSDKTTLGNDLYLSEKDGIRNRTCSDILYDIKMW